MDKISNCRPSKVRWSSQPKESYSVLYDGEMVGIGLDPIFDAAPGAWNIMWLTSAEKLESLLAYGDDPGQFPASLGSMPLAIATALQAHGDRLLGELAEEMKPRQFLDYLRNNKVDPIINQIHGHDIWFDIASDNIKKHYIELADNVNPVDFRQGG
ncbi:hypothetical protein [Desulfurivibrio alkaliphilus]|nr:hypothetical protein [Desulfurivibrio alkaliphilus]